MVATANDPSLKHLHLRENLFTGEEQILVDEVLTVLQPLKIATLLVSGEKNPTASRILPTLAKLKFEMSVKEGDFHVLSI